MQITYKFRLYPSKQEEEKLLWTLEKCRFVYNRMLAELNGRTNPNKYELERQLPFLKDDHPELKGVYSQVLQNEVFKLFWNLKTLSRLKKNGKKVGKLRFKGKGWFKTFTYPQFGFKIIKTGRRLDVLRMSKIGDVPMRMHRKIDGRIKPLTVKRHATGKWFACISVERNFKAERKPVGKMIGLDVGLKHFLTDSKGRQIENPKFYEKTLERIKAEQKKLSRKIKSSKNQMKQKLKLAKPYEKLVNQRDDFLHKLSRFYVDNYDLIAVENLNIKNMVRNRWLASRILDASWGKFLRLIEHKAEKRAGVQVVRVNPRGTSKIKHEGLDRDYNASLNILERCLSGLGRSLEPVETEPLRELNKVPASSVIETGSPCDRWSSSQRLAKLLKQEALCDS